MPVFEKGARVVVPLFHGHCGLATVVDVVDRDGEAYNVVQFDPVAPGVQAATLQVQQSVKTWPWAAPTPAQARTQLARLLTPAPADDRDWKARHKAFAHVMATCDPQALMDFARGQWARAERPTFAEAQIGRQLAEVVVAPVAEALGMSTNDLMARVRPARTP